MRPETVLAFDTSAAHCAAALLLADGRCLLQFEDMAKGQAERLLPMLESLLTEAKVRWRDLTAIAVGTGPGNFTGVRIAVAAARGLALGLGIPAVGVTRLEALAFGVPRPLIVVEDARRGEVYVQPFSRHGAEPAALIEASKIVLPQGFALVGSGGPELASVRDQSPAQSSYALAEAIARIGAERARTPQPRPAPFYLRGADAAPPSDPPPVIFDA